MSSHILSNVAPTDKNTLHSTTTTLASNNTSSINNDAENEKSEGSFLTLILSKIANKKNIEPKKIISFMKKNQELLELNGKLDDSSLLEEATFIQILHLLEKLGNPKEGNLIPKFNDKLKSLLKDAFIVEEFKGAKSLQDILNLSKKYNLGLEKITITQKELAQLEKTFPKLVQQGFFKQTKRVITSEILVNRTSGQTTPQKEEPITLSKILQAMENKKTTKNKKEDFIEPFKEDTTKLAEKTTNKSKSIHQTNLSTKLENIKQNGSNITQESALNIQSKTNTFQNELTNESIDKKIEPELQTVENEKENTTLNIKNEKIISHKNVKNIDIKQTFNTFANDFKEKLEQYKPPIMKVQLSLNPKELGHMDITVITRGSNLHVNFASNTQAMNLFIQNQLEFKNSLVNMGFTNLEMNFSDQKGQQERKKESKDEDALQELDEFLEYADQENTILNMVIPNYV